MAHWDDDFEIEVTDLRTGQVLKTTHDMPVPEVHSEMPPTPRSVPAATAEDYDYELEIEVSDLSGARAPTLGEMPMRIAVPSRQRPTRRQVIGASASAALVVVVLVGLLGGSLAKVASHSGCFRRPCPPLSSLMGQIPSTW